MQGFDQGLYARRQLAQRLAMILVVAATGFGLLWLVAILGSLLYQGLGALSPALFTETTPPPGSRGGLLNAIYGSLVMTLGAVALGTPIGILTGTYLAEYGRGRLLATVVRFISDILLSAPSIVIGLFIYEVLVLSMGHFSAWAGVAALAVGMAAALHGARLARVGPRGYGRKGQRAQDDLRRGDDRSIPRRSSIGVNDG